MTPAKIILGTRGSELALTQTTMVTAALQTAHPHLQIERQIIQTSGDKRQDLRFSEFSDVAQVDKGIFIKELEIALADSQIDAAVHSLKDVPSDLAAGFTTVETYEPATAPAAWQLPFAHRRTQTLVWRVRA